MDLFSKLDFRVFFSKLSESVRVRWSSDKAKILGGKTGRRGVSFEDCLLAMSEGKILDEIAHPTRKNQRLLILDIMNYAYAVPFVIEEDGTYFLKTVFPSRKYQALYFNRKDS